MDISFSLITNINDLYEDLLKPLGISKAQYKKAGLKKSLSFNKKKTLSLPANLLRNGEVNPIYVGPEIKILHEDENFLAVSKPYGVHGHPHLYDEQDTVLNYLRTVNKCPRYGGAERGLLYRLDGETSGVLVLAKKENIFSQIRENFSTFAKEKIYLAIVHGEVKKEGSVVHKLSSAGVKGSKQVESLDGKEAQLDILKSFYSAEKNLSLVQVSLKTGQRHQIRVQLSILGHPILGDILYGGEQSERLFLHAYHYSFEWEGVKRDFKDSDAKLFDKFFDLNCCL